MSGTLNRTWGMHTQNDLLFLNESVIAIGWEELGDLSRLSHTKDALKAEYHILEYYDKLPDRSKKINPLSAVYIPDVKSE